MTRRRIVWPPWYDGPKTSKAAERVRRFLAWVDDHPEILAAFIARAVALVRRGQRCSSARVWEGVRAVVKHDGRGTFALCNSHRSLVARLAMHRCPELAKRIPIRPLGEGGGQIAGATLGVVLDRVQQLELRLAEIAEVAR